jgi:Tfp pilus assembly protein PilF
MSLIVNALKTAQRERARRESQGARASVAPVLVPLRSTPKTGLDQRRVLVLSIAGVLVLALGTVALVNRPSKPALPSVPPLTSTILTEALADSGGRAPRSAYARPAHVRDSARAVVAPGPQPSLETSTRAAVQVAVNQPASRATGAAAIPQGATRASIPDTAEPAPTSDGPSTGRLRIAVDGSAQPETTRLLADAVEAHRAGDFTAARKLYDSVLVLAPRDADALNNLGVLLSAQREYGRALEVLRRASTIAQRNAGVWNNIGTVFHEQGKNNEAIAAFRHALALDSRHYGAKVGLAQQYLAISALGQAKDLLDEVVAARPNLAEAQYTLGQVLELQGDRAGAIRAYDAFIKAAPSRLASHVELVRRRIETLTRGS